MLSLLLVGCAAHSRKKTGIRTWIENIFKVVFGLSVSIVGSYFLYILFGELFWLIRNPGVIWTVISSSIHQLLTVVSLLLLVGSVVVAGGFLLTLVAKIIDRIRPR
jgi:hypothetical protein